ncbi:fungal-specific transcription factor domain-containing protein [Xylaria palmicola]|nr:fungal-specific transcription factor domain-containing protein [Xylaria palmicola]
MAENTANGPALAQQRVVKRPRPVKSCLECRRRKLKCDRLLSCTQCQKAQRPCRYVPDGEISDASDTEVPDRAPKRKHVLSSQDGSLHPAHSKREHQEDYGARLDKLERILLEKNSPLTEASSSGSRAQRPMASALTMRGLTVKDGSRTRFFGPSSTRVLVNLFDEAKEFMFNDGDSSDVLHPFLLTHKIHKAVQNEHRKLTAPITVFVDSMTPIHKRMADLLPSKHTCDHLLQVYLNGSETIYRVLHIPTFMSQYNQYWEGHQQPAYFLPQLLSVLCIGYRFFGAGIGQFQGEREGIHVPTACALVRAWLVSLRGKQLVEFSSLQGEVLALMAERMLNLQNHETWMHLGLLVRMAMTMGLHRDPSEFSRISPFWAEQRRKLWLTILELDIHMSLLCNLPSCIREGDFTCRPPGNFNDNELFPTMIELPPSKPIQVETDSRIQVYAATTLMARFKVVDLVNRIDAVQDYQQILDIGNELEQALEDIRYIVPQRNSINAKEAHRQWTTRVVLDMNCRRPLLALYRPFALSSVDAPQHEVDPATPDYAQIWHMHNLILRQDIMHASFGVCYYMKRIQAGATSTRESETPEYCAGPDLIEVACTTASRSSMLLSLPRLRATVESVIDTMIKRIGEVGTNLKDLVSLAIVFYTYQGETREPKKHVKEALQRIVDAGLQAIHASQEDISALTMVPATGQMQMMNYQTDPSLLISTDPFMWAADMPTALSDDYAQWGSEFWNPFITNHTPVL